MITSQVQLPRSKRPEPKNPSIPWGGRTLDV